MRTVLSAWASLQALGPDLPRPRQVRSTAPDEAVAFARDLGGRVVARASGAAQAPQGGPERRGLGPEGVAACWEELAGAGDGTVLVAEQLDAELELLAGGLRDPQFGPLVSVGIGGIAAEVFGDVAFVLSPPEPGEVEEALRRLRGAALLDGYRGHPPVDRRGLERVVGAIAHLLRADPRVVAIDCNPVLVVDGVPLVAEARVVRE